jgi:type IV secretory pathway VirB10-like protein
VYGYHKRKILVPAGSTAIGRYKPLQKVGDTRLDIEFYRVLTPEGINIQLTGFASDSEGSQGLTGEIDNKNWEKFGVAGIAAGIQAAAQLSVDVNDNRERALADSVTQPIGEVITQVLSESINIAPTVRIQKGTMFFIKFQADIFFPPARDKQVITQVINDATQQEQARR